MVTNYQPRYLVLAFLLVILLLVIRIGTSLFHPKALADIRSSTNGRRGLRISIFLVGGELGHGIWPILASLIVVRIRLSYLWIIDIPGMIMIVF